MTSSTILCYACRSAASSQINPPYFVIFGRSGLLSTCIGAPGEYFRLAKFRVIRFTVRSWSTRCIVGESEASVYFRASFLNHGASTARRIFIGSRKNDLAVLSRERTIRDNRTIRRESSVKSNWDLEKSLFMVLFQVCCE